MTTNPTCCPLLALFVRTPLCLRPSLLDLYSVSCTWLVTISLRQLFTKCREFFFKTYLVFLSRYTTRKRAPKSHRLSETPIEWRNTSDTFTPRGLGYNRASCELVNCFELKESDGELRRSCLRRQPACLQPCARLVILGSEEDLRGNTTKLVAGEYV